LSLQSRSAKITTINSSAHDAVRCPAGQLADRPDETAIIRRSAAIIKSVCNEARRTSAIRRRRTPRGLSMPSGRQTDPWKQQVRPPNAKMALIQESSSSRTQSSNGGLSPSVLRPAVRLGSCTFCHSHFGFESKFQLKSAPLAPGQTSHIVPHDSIGVVRKTGEYQDRTVIGLTMSTNRLRSELRINPHFRH